MTGTGMTELEYVLSRFEETFFAWKGKRVALHGTRAYAQGILERFDGAFSFVGILDYERGRAFCGRPVMTKEGLCALQPDLVILTERVKYEEQAWLDIREICADRKIPVRNMYGVDPEAVHREFREESFRTFEEWEKVIRCHDVIVFELVQGFFPLVGETLGKAPEMSGKILKCAEEEGKPVLFSCRKSYPRQRQEEHLTASGFVAEKDLEKALIIREGEDLSFRSLTERFPGKRIAYLANGFVNEYALPRNYGIDTYYYGESCPDFSRVSRQIFSAGLPQTDGRPAEAVYGMVREKLSGYDIVTFDLFDTLIMRRALEPADVVRLTVREAIRRGMTVPDGFADARIRYEAEHPRFSVDKVYEGIASVCGGEDKAEALKHLEWETERRTVCRRESVCRLMEELHRAGKTVAIVSDTLYPETQLRRLLEEMDIHGYDRVYSSCDAGMLKTEGLFFRVREDLGKEQKNGLPYVHVGDDPAADHQGAMAAGFDTVHISSAREAFDRAGSRMAGLADLTQTERDLLGCCLAAAFNDPFRPAAYEELPLPQRDERFAVMACTPIILGYLLWLIRQVKDGPYGKILFLSRDGYLPCLLYGLLAEKEKGCLPEGIYLYANRHAGFRLCADRVDDVRAWLPQQADTGTDGAKILRTVFHIPAREGELSFLLTAYAGEIQKDAEQQREAFAQYRKSAGLEPGTPYAVMDFVSGGTTQWFLENGGGLTLTGFYVSRSAFGRDRDCRIYSWFEKGEGSLFLRNYLEMESVLTSPEPAVDGYDTDGTPHFADEYRTSETLDRVSRIHDMITRTVLDLLELPGYDGGVVRPCFAEALYGMDGLHGTVGALQDDWIRKDLA